MANEISRARLKTYTSSGLLGRDGLINFRDKVKDLCDVASEIAPDGGIYTILIDRRDVFTPNILAIRNIMDLESIYSYKNLQKNPELAVEFGEVSAAIKTLNKTIEKRKYANRKSFTKRKDGDATESKKVETKEVSED